MREDVGSRTEQGKPRRPQGGREDKEAKKKERPGRAPSASRLRGGQARDKAPLGNLTSRPLHKVFSLPGARFPLKPSLDLRNATPVMSPPGSLP